MYHQEEPIVNFEIGPQHEEFEFLVDTGADRSSIKKLPVGVNMGNRTCEVIGAEGKPFTASIIEGVEVRGNSRQIITDFIYLPDLESNLLGRDLQVQLGVGIFPEKGRMKVRIMKLTTEDLKEINPEVWAEGGKSGLLDIPPIKIEMQPGTPPIRVKQYPISLEGKKGLALIIEQLLKEGILEPCMSPHNTPILAVKKAEGKYRLVQDLREINKRTVTRYPVVPNPYTLLSQIPREHAWFTIIDLKDAFWACPLAKESRDWFAFEWDHPETKRKQQLRWTRLPQGFTESPNLFGQPLEELLEQFAPEGQPHGPVVLYSKIRQGQSESFTDFVERLSRAIEVQVKSKGAHDAPRFAFSVPTINRDAPRKRYHWRVLPQGLKVSPVICQWYVASLLSPVHVAAEKAIIHHYMDDVLVCAPTDDVLSHALDLTINALVVAGLELQEDKVQKMPPWRYLGLEIGKRTIVPQKLEIRAKIQTLADVHQLCGALNWVRPWLGLTTEDLAPLFNLLKGGEELSSPRELTPEAKDALEKVQHLMSTWQAHRCDPDLPFKFIIMGNLPHLHGVIFQWKNNTKKDPGREDPLLIIEWVFLSHHRSKRMTRPQELVAELIWKARVRIRELAGCDFECIHIPIGLRSGQITKAMLEHLLQENEALQFALDSFTGQISVHRPAHKIFNQDAKFTLSLKSVWSRKPLEALTIFTDASGRSHKSVMTWKDPQTQQWEADVAEVEGSPQVAELAAVVRAFERFPEPFNLVTDSAYVAGVVSRVDQAILQEVSNTALFELLSKLVKLVSHREQPFFVLHTRSHTYLPGYIAEGNRRADALAAPAAMAPLPNIFEQAKLSHQLFHQNAPGLVRRFHITWEQAKAIVATCPSCNQHALPTLSAGVNPRGLKSCELWQTDVTHIPQFGRSKYVHVSVDTFSGAVFASTHTGEKTSDVIKHLIQAFSFMGIPRELKTDNGPAYRSREFSSFLQQWGVGHKTGIPHSPTGQAVVERIHREIKRVLNQQQQVLKMETPQTRLARVLFTVNFLNCTFELLNPPIVRHFGANPQLNIKERLPVMVRDPETGRTEGPHDLVTWDCGYACMSTPTGLKWLPSKWVRPYVLKVSGEKKQLPQVSRAAFRRRRRESLSGMGSFS
ncbi:hypothetical protein DUI87_19131 [Hirundo rustica rustica]|uniref:Uncharacterized protein n=1 Tax=Hirundo rustica rustica TaxID=333673 RepID=A0A3M0JTI7_HIRRU|nr:hypothetical protein DUI87_19131 [Hirundo rustica rustica]